MDKYTIFCTPEQTKKAIELGAPIDDTGTPDDMSSITFIYEYDNGEYCIVFCPTAEQMIGWLETQHVRVYAQPYTDECDKKFKGKIHTIGEHTVKISKSRKEATLAAIDAALDYLVRTMNA